MRKVLVRVEKTEAYNLQAGDVFSFDEKPPGWWEAEFERMDVALPVHVRTNVTCEDLEDQALIVYKLIIVPIEDRPKPRTTFDPHSPPGVH